MYIRPVHAELDVPTLQQFIRSYPLGLFTTSIPSPKYATLQTTHIPFVLSTLEDDPEDKGKLRGHMARANPQAKAIIDALNESGEDELSEEVLILFNAPVHSYVTPKFYVESKPADGKVVPTWDFAAVQVYGRATIHYKNNDATGSFLQQQVEDLSREGEQSMLKRSGKEGIERPWKVSDAPQKYVDTLKKGIIGIEITIERIEGRFKLHQEVSDGDWQGVVDGFKALGTSEGDTMVAMLEQRGSKRSVQ
ncbi:hypothetical protein CI109_100033 [Kwoniella shandongensis]|uniref:Uncharacterized protein n=1 Tax=Kwoniella shandongensis TaxID=1734106 RepID=A0A5M6BS66_9TREE|nr:uncharacterized protein CI109_005994 [Kwoniella shandongensis]KAA5525686.1 hypothetical protein CI109_005994 [Kwoniella shandongensis]